MDIADPNRRYIAEETMVSKHGLTIRDYLARHTLSRDLLKQWSAALKGPRDDADPFARLLKSSLSPDDGKVNRADGGLTAADYLARPVRAHPSVQKGPQGDSGDTFFQLFAFGDGRFFSFSGLPHVPKSTRSLAGFRSDGQD